VNTIVALTDLDALAERINAAHERVCANFKTTLEHAVEAGHLLIAAKRAVRHGKWMQWCAAHCRFSQRTINYYMELAEALGDRIATVANFPLRDALRLIGAKTGNQARLDACSGNDEWPTPLKWVDRARRVMGTIDVDPASSFAAQRIIQAKTYYTIAEDGLKQEWHGNIWLNPPFSRYKIQQFADKAVAEFAAGRLEQGIFLTHACPDTRWYRQFEGISSRFAFPHKRIRFNNASSPVLPHMFFYVGMQTGRFIEEFDGDCTVLQKAVS
jgi:hypothetical protein